MRARWRHYQPIPDVLAHPPACPPRLEFIGKAHNSTKRQYAVWNAGEIVLGDCGYHTEIDMFYRVRLIYQVDANRSSPPLFAASLNVTVATSAGRATWRLPVQVMTCGHPERRVNRGGPD
jgi:hypothetical protein